MAARLELQFQRFLASGDPEVMARIFDDTAPKLARLAGHLCQDPGEVEELVQATFVAVLEHRQRFQQGEKVLPWMLGILTHKWHHLVRERRRRPDPARLEPRPAAPDDPQASARSRELSAELRRQLAEMPQPYGEVLQLHLLGGLEPKEVAERLGRNRNTVRAQLQRGLDRLRSALPAGFAAGVGVGVSTALLSPQSLAAMRHHVLAQAASTRVLATSGSAVAGGSTLTTVMAMKKTLSLAAVALLAFVALWSFGLWDEDDPEVPDVPKVHRQAGGTQSDMTGTPELDVGDTRTPVAAEVVADKPTAGQPIEFTGRCIDAETLQPLPGVKVVLEAWPVDPVMDYRHAVGRLVVPAPATTGIDGRFRLQGRLPLGRHGVMLRFEKADRVHRGGTWTSSELTNKIGLGDVAMQVGVRVRGRVVDLRGRPVAQAMVRFPNLEMAQCVRPFDSGGTGSTAQTDDQGRFEIPSAVPVGNQPIFWSRNGYGARGPNQVFLAPGRVAELRLQMVAHPTIEGRAVDGNGQPVAGLEVSAMLPGRNRSLGHGRSDVTGRFIVRRHKPGDGTKVDLRFRSNGGIVPPKAARSARWGERDLVVQAQRAVHLQLEVVGPDGRPVTDYAVICSPLWLVRGREVAVGDQRVRHFGHHAAGRLQVDKVWPGPNRLQVLPRSARFSSSEPQRFVAAESENRLRVQLVGGRALDLQVVDRRGQPVVGSRVDVVEVDEEDVQPQYDLHWESLLARAWTDRSGRARAHIPAGRSSIAVQVFGDTHLPTLVPNQPVPGSDGVLRVVVPDGGRLRGQIVPAEIALPGIGLVLQDAGEPWNRWPRQEEGILPVAGDGSFDLKHLPPGEWHVHLQLGPEVREPALARVTLKEGGELAIRLDARGHVPAKLTGRVLVAGRTPSALSAVSLYPASTSAHAWVRASCRVAADGSFTLRNLPAGRYRLGLRTVHDGNFRCFLDPDWVEIQAGQVANKTVDLVHRRMILRLLDAEGNPVQARHATLRSKTCSFRWSLPVEADGTLRLDPAPAMACEIWVAGRLFGEVKVPSDGAQAVIELRAKRN